MYLLVKLRPHQECEAQPLVSCGDSARIVSECYSVQGESAVKIVKQS